MLENLRFHKEETQNDDTFARELARLAHVTQPRMTQIMNLLHLAPDIQEEILFLPEVAQGRDPITERDLRPLTQILNWDGQRAAWRDIARVEVS